MQPINDPTANWAATPAQPGVFAGQPQPAVFPVGQQPMMMGGMMGYAVTSAGTALVISLVGLLCCQPLGIVSLIMANQALGITSMNPGHPDQGTARAAQIISIIAIIITILSLIYYAFIFSLFMSDPDF